MSPFPLAAEHTAKPIIISDEKQLHSVIAKPVLLDSDFC